ncbi:MAG: DUF4129 domain-containing protein [Firmicutes bacterium]|nr:DUF4129 domain-containing protein [Bacillota bacterium]
MQEKHSDADIDRILKLVRQQGHWLERFILPGLAGIFTISLLVLARQYLAVLAPRITVPGWVMMVGAIAAIESIYAAGFHLRMRTPMSLRIAEFAVVLGLVYAGLRAGGVGHEAPFFSSVIWRDPQILVPLLLVAGAWTLARGYGQTFVWLGDIAREVGDQGAATFSWETESYLSDFQVSSGRARAVGYFTRRFLFYVCLACLCKAVIIESFSDRLGPLVHWNSMTNVATVSLLASGMLLQACVYLYRLRVIWQEVGVPVCADLPRQWLWSSLVSVGLVLVVAVVLPAGLSPLNFSDTMEMLARWMGAGMEFSLPQSHHDGGTGYLSPAARMGPPEVGTFSWLVAILYFAMSAILVLLAVGAIAALIGLVLLTFFKGEWEKLHGLARFPIYIYLWLRETARQLISLLAAGARRGQQLYRRLKEARPTLPIGKDTEKMLSERMPPSAAALYIRHLYALLIEATGRYGLGPHTGQTALEYSVGLGSRLDGAQEELELLTDYYLQARYSRYGFSAGIRPVVDSLWKSVMAAVDRWREKEVAETSEGDADEIN